jgi:hypothetical protein
MTNFGFHKLAEKSYKMKLSYIHFSIFIVVMFFFSSGLPIPLRYIYSLKLIY